MPQQYPIPRFHFIVQWGGARIGFSEVTGLSQENQPTEYRDGSTPVHSRVKNPGLRKFDNITLKRGVVESSSDFYNWLLSVERSTVARHDITVSLLNEKHAPAKTWKVRNAYPVKVEGPVLKATGNEVAIESVELAHEGFALEDDKN